MGPRQRIQGQRPRPGVGGSARGLRQGQQLSFLTVDIDATPAAWVIPQLIAIDAAGGDSTRAWRRAVERDFEQQYGVAPPGVAATFVLQWVVGALADTAVALHATGEVDWMGDQVSIDLAAIGNYPVRAVVAPDGVTVSRPDDLGGFERHYRQLADRFVTAYRPAVKISSRQRSGMVRDMWQQATRGPGLPRESCCLMYALPGLQVCRGCPRVS